MRVPTSCRSMTSSVEAAQHVRGRLARLAVERVDRHAPPGVVAPCPVSIMFSCTSDRKPCCGPKMRRRARARPDPPRRRSATCRNSRSIEAGLQTMPTRAAVEARPRPAGGRIPSVTGIARDYSAAGPAATCLPIGPALVDYPPLVVCPACFARAESRSSLKSDSLPPSERRADVRHLPCSSDRHRARR